MSGIIAYSPRRVSRSRYVAIRGVRYHVREWGQPDHPTLLCLHGARDASISFQFVVDALQGPWHVIAPDWRGHGLTAWTPGSYWTSDFLADLDALMTELAPGDPIALMAHSMGGNIAGLYAGLRPSRVGRLVLLDSLGPLPNKIPVPMADTLRRYLDSATTTLKQRAYAGYGDMAARLLGQNPRLDPARAQFLAEATGQALPSGGCAWPFDPGFARSWPSLHTLDEWRDCWQRSTAPILCLLASEQRSEAATADAAALRERARCFCNLTLRTVADTSHNLHFDAPDAVARTAEAFLCAADSLPS